MLSAGVGLWSLGTLIAPPAAKMSLLALCASRVFVGLGEGLAPSSATGIMAKLVPECAQSARAGLVPIAASTKQACRPDGDGSLARKPLPAVTSTDSMHLLQARARSCGHSGLRQSRCWRRIGAHHLRAADQACRLAGRVLPVRGAGGYLVPFLAARAA